MFIFFTVVTNITERRFFKTLKLSSKSLGLTPGTPLAVFTDGSTLLMKPIEIPKADVFEKLLKESRKTARAAGLKPSDIAKTVKKVRNENRS